MFPALFDKTEVDGFLVTQGRNAAAHSKGASHIFFANLGCDGGQRRCGGQLGIAHHARHFFNEVFLNFQIETPAGGIDGDQAFGFSDFKS